MADLDEKISAMPAASALTGPELLAGVQSGINVAPTAAQIKTFASASPSLVTPALGTPASGTLTNATGLPIGAGTTGTLAVNRGGTGVTTATGTGSVVLSVAPAITGLVDAQTAVAGAATSAKPNVQVTSEGLTAATSYTLTLTDALVASTSVIQCGVTTSTAAVTGVQIASITPGSGSLVIVVAMAALTGTLKFNISIFN